MSETYSGRLFSDGKDMLADEREVVGSKTVSVFDSDGEPVLDELGNQVTVEVQLVRFGKDHGRRVAFDEGNFIFIADGEPSHNERFQQRIVDLVVTQTDDSDSPGYAGDPDNPIEGNEHHFGVLSDDAHFDGLKFDRDDVAAKITGHTAAYRDG